MKKFIIFLVLLVQTLFAACAFAETALPPRPTAGSGIYVQDYAGVISKEDRQQMLSIGQDLDNKTTAQLAVITVNSLDGEPLEDYALAVLRNWGIGNKAKNNGVLIVVAVEDRRSRIEVGYGLEGVLPDGKTGRIQEQYMLPYFKKGAYSTGITQGYKAIAGLIAQSEGVELSGVKYSGGAKNGQGDIAKSLNISDILVVIAIIAVLLFDNLFLGGFLTQMLLWTLFRGGGRGGGGFGGGSGGGGGSSRHW